MLKRMKKFNSKKAATPNNLQKKAPSPDDYCATKVNINDLSLEINDLKHVSDESTPRTSSHTQMKQLPCVSPAKKYVNNGLGTRFQGRRPTRKNVPRPSTPSSLLHTPAFGVEKASPVSREAFLSLIVPLGKITGMAVSRGIELRRIKREKDIGSGRTKRVILTPRQKPTGGNRFKMIRYSEKEIKDPIKRAGRRLLSNAAVPIQTAARRYLAKQEALDRMWAIIQLQSFIRRWRCEANFQAHIHSAILIQKTARGLLARAQVQEFQSNAVIIQKIIRGYLAALRVYDAIYYVCRLQALVRSFLVRLENARKKEAAAILQAFYTKVQERKSSAAIDIQRFYRGYKVYKWASSCCGSANSIPWL
jgi:hypothetical protein